MRCNSPSDWELLFGRVLAGDAHALVALRNAAIELAAFVRAPWDSPVPPWLREELAEEAFERTKPHFQELETWRRAFGYMRKTMDRLIVRTVSLGERLPLDKFAERLVDPRSALRITQMDFSDFIFETARTLSQRRYRQLRAMVQACWAQCEGRGALAKEAGICPRTWSSERKDLLKHLRKLLGDLR